MIKFFVSLVFFFLVNFLFSQSYGNEWINYSQRYFTFKIAKEGIYKIDGQTLKNSGVDVSIFKSANMQLFAREKEIPMYVNDGGDGAFDPKDYFLFYAKANDGWLDSLLYDNKTDIGNPSYSLINDTITYFFTWNNSTSNFRFEKDSSVNYQSYNPSSYWTYLNAGGNRSYYVESLGKSNESSSFYKPGEGWSFNVDGVKTNQSFTVEMVKPDYIYTGPDAPLVEIESKNTSHSNAPYSGKGNHHFSLSLKPSNILLVDTVFSGHQLITTNRNFSTSDLFNGSSLNYSIINDQGALTDFQGWGFLSYKIPLKTSLQGLKSGKFWITNNSKSSKVRLDIVNAKIQKPIALSWGTSPKFLFVSPNGNENWQVLIPNTTNGQIQEFVLQDESLINTTSLLTPVNGTGFFTKFNEISTENSILMVYPKALEVASMEYAGYRTSIEGGGYNVVFANIDELYLQYGGGIPKHCIAIRRFAKHMYDKSIHKPISLYLMGKALAHTMFRTNQSNYQACLVPSYGIPSSDIAFTANFDGNWEPLIPTGRITVRTPQELRDYLSKVKEYELNQLQKSVYNSETKDWQKHMIHFSGGTNKNQQTLFQGYLAKLENIAINKYFGASVMNVKKESSTPIDPVKLTEVTNRIAEGVSVMTFFGHSNAATFDVGIDEPDNWNNKGKYPFIMGNGCNSGDVFSNLATFSEKVVNTVNEGAIAFLSPSSLGYDSYLSKYSTQFYTQFVDENYGGTLGDHMKRTIASLSKNKFNALDEVTSFQMNLNGDPLLKINYHNNPEIEVTTSSVYFGPENITLATDSIEIGLAIKNLGKSILDTFQIEIRRRLPNAYSDSVYLFRKFGLHYLDTFNVKLPIYSSASLGDNVFSFNIDIPSAIKEQYDEITNNQVTQTYKLLLDGIVPIYPYNYAIVGNDSITFRASTIDPFAPLKTYRFEIDTTDLFNSHFAKNAVIQGSGGVQSIYPSNWKNKFSQLTETLKLKDSSVYFWRVTIDSSVLNWHESSFQYIKGKTGWGQAHFFQMKNNDFYKISYNRQIREKSFDTLVKKFEISVYDNPLKLSQYQEMSYKLNSEMQDYGACYDVPSLHVIVIDPNTLTPWKTHYKNENPQNSFGNFNDVGGCIPRSQGYFVFRQNDSTALANFQNMVTNKIPDGHYVIIYTIRYPQYENWNSKAPNMYQTFKNLGSDSIVQGRDNHAFIFFCKKGDKSSVKEKVATSYGELIYLTENLKGFDNTGTEITPFIGPSKVWNSIYWKNVSLESSSSDTTFLRIQGFDLNQNLVVQFDTLMHPKDSILNIQERLGNSVNFLKMQALYKDNKAFSPSQLNRWQVLYQPLPEAAVSTKDGFVWLPIRDSLDEGTSFKFAANIKNVSEYPMDSLLVNYTIIDQYQKRHLITFPRVDSLRATASRMDTIVFSTGGYVGNNVLEMEVNPYISMNMTDQPEQFHFNNVIQKRFYVKSDNINPILDVTFDGKHIMHNDLVSAKPEIEISLKDENSFAIMNSISDTSLFGVYLVDPSGTQRRIPFYDTKGSPVLNWIPATAQTKKFRIQYSPVFTVSGNYSLIVQGADRNGNLSGDNAYKITFEVITESKISYLTNYPNPFSSSTRFVYTLTGSEAIDQAIIQIMTVSGKVVREITRDELGPLQVGRNIVTAYAWDGKDNFGDQLANGVYLYRVLTRSNGEAVKHYDSKVDANFNHEFGKMYLLR